MNLTFPIFDLHTTQQTIKTLVYDKVFIAHYRKTFVGLSMFYNIGRCSTIQNCST